MAKKVVKKKLTKEEEDEMLKHQRCINCEFAYLMQSNEYDPIISLCKKTHERQVAKMFVCRKEFKERKDEMVINPMIKVI